MTQEDFKKAEKGKKVDYIDPSEDAAKAAPVAGEKKQGEFDLAALLAELKSPRRAVSAAPTYTPKNFLEQIVFYESGTTRRLYLFINRSWRYVTLT